MTEQIKALASRKFMFVVGIYLSSVGLLIGKQITSDNWLRLAQVIIIVYICGNIAQKVAPKILGKK